MIERLMPFLKKQVYNDKTAGSCREVVLQHYSVGAKGDTVDTWEILPEHRENDSGLRKLAAEIAMSASSDAAGVKGTQTYTLKAFHGDNDKPSGRYTFRVDGDAEGGDDEMGLSSEPPTPKGLLSQTMRHLEVTMKTSMMGVATAVNALERIASRASQRAEDLERDRIRSFEAIEKSISMEHERKIEVMKEETRQKAMGELAGQVKQLVPVVMAKLSGGHAQLPAPAPIPAPVNEGIAALFASLSDAQKMQIFAALTDEQRAVFAGVAEAMMNKPPA